MPVNVTGVKQLQKALREVDPTLNITMRKYIKNQMIPVRNKAQGYLPKNEEVLSGWTKLAGIIGPMKYRSFPKYDESVARKGIVYREGKNTRNNRGFSAIFYVANITAPGAIYETAGRKHPSGDPKSQSLNPGAGKQFIDGAGGQMNMKGFGKQRGRVIYRAWAEENGRVIPAVVKAIDYTATKFNKETELMKAA
jgi:hypothetical protein